MRLYIAVTLMGAGLFAGCVDYSSDLCIPHVDTFCYQGQTYWLDSCDRTENVLEECECGCRADQYGCRTCGEKECETDADCPQGFFCDRTDWLCKMLNCVPECDGKCCGTDGCGGICPDYCPRGDICNPSSCRCEDARECQVNDDCPQGYWCDRTVWQCRPIECIPNCTGKCCGHDGCAGTCPNTCPPGYYCNQATCRCEGAGCYTDADCRPTQCCMNGVCVDMACGTFECGPDPVCGKECGPCRAGFHCDQGTCIQDVACTSDAHCLANQCCLYGTCVPMACGALECGPDPVCGKECGPCPPGETCNNGVCEYGDEFLCPPGQECVLVDAEGVMGCVIPPNTVPPENQTGCNPQNHVYCDGNFSCYCLDATCSDSVCVENCGTCPAGSECCELWQDGPWGCLAPGCTDIPPNPPYCDQNTPCSGNAGCFTDGTNNFCINFCSVNYGP